MRLFHGRIGSEASYSVEGGVVCVVEIPSSVHGCTAEEQNIVALKEEVNVLQSLLGMLRAVAEVVQVADRFKFVKLL